MKKTWFRLMVAVLAVLTLLCVYTPSAFADEEPGYRAYDPDAALSYAAAHWNDGKGKCAAFVSNCLVKAGIRFSKATDKAGNRLKNGIYPGCWGLYKDLSARSFVTVSVLKSRDKKYYWSDNAGLIEPGDVVFFHSKTDKSTNQYKHVVLVSDDTAGGTIKYYAHNSARNGHYNLRTQSNTEMVVIHFRNYNEYCTSYETHGSVRIKKETNLKTYPCSVATFERSATYATLQPDETVEVIRLVENDRGNFWYEVSYDGRTGLYVYSGDTQWLAWDGSDITANGLTLPSGQVAAGKDVALGGTVSAKYNRISQITGFITQKSGTIVAAGCTNTDRVASVAIRDTDLMTVNVTSVRACGNYFFVIQIRCEYAVADGNRLACRVSDSYTVAQSSFLIG